MNTVSYKNITDPSDIDIDSALAIGAALLAVFRTTCGADPATFTDWLAARSQMTPADACRLMHLAAQADALDDERGLDLATSEAMAYLEIDFESLPAAELDDPGHIAWRLLKFPPSDRLTPVLF